MMRIDHLVVTAPDIESGASFVEERLGVMTLPGGKHGMMGTHNRLISLGDCYLEVISTDPDAPPPGRPRWFGLDDVPSRPALTHWAAQMPDLGPLAIAMPELGRISDFTRGELNWQMPVSADGKLPFAGGFPAPICWRGDTALSRLPDSGLRLRRLVIHHPEATALELALAPWLDDSRILILSAAATRLEAVIDTPAGECSL